MSECLLILRHHARVHHLWFSISIHEAGNGYENNRQAEVGLHFVISLLSVRARISIKCKFHFGNSKHSLLYVSTCSKVHAPRATKTT
jgi:hypothetical protein